MHFMRTIIHLEPFTNKPSRDILHGMKNRIVSFSVVRDENMFRRCVAGNPFCRNIEIHSVDNSRENLGIPKRYNDFLDAFDYDRPGWIVFCHEDFELREDLAPRLSRLPTDAIHGPCGARHRIFFGLFSLWQVTGRVRESNKDGSHEHHVGDSAPNATVLDTLDCMCLVVHSSLVEKHHLRFDENLMFDLYVEDFGIHALLTSGIYTRLLNISCCHHSTRFSLPDSYYRQLSYLNRKYPHESFAGTCSYIGGSILARNFCGSLLPLLRFLLRKI